MKNKLFRKVIINFLIKEAIWTVFLQILFFIKLEIQHSNFQWAYDISPNIYFFCEKLFYKVSYWMNNPYNMILIWLIGTFFLLYRLMKKVFSYLSIIVNATDDLVNKKTENIELPSELVELEKQMNSLKREAEKNEALAKEQEQRKNDLIVYLAHDIKTPLTSMIGYLSLLQEVKDMPQKQRNKYIDVALDKSYRLEELINELFDIARFNSEKILLEKEELNITLMLEQIIDDFYPTLKDLNKKIILNYHEPIYLLADSDKLARVFNNVIKNAIYYSKENTNITISIENKNENVNVIITNKGKKIPKEKLDRIFEKFYRVDSARTSKTGGSGLGLAIAKEIVELHDGTIKAISDEEQTTIEISLPIKQS